MELLGQNPGFTFKLLGKNLNREGPSRLVVIINIIFIHCCARELLYAKMLKKLKVKKQSALLLSFLSLVAFQLGGAGLLATPMSLNLDVPPPLSYYQGLQEGGSGVHRAGPGGSEDPTRTRVMFSAKLLNKIVISDTFIVLNLGLHLHSG